MNLHGFFSVLIVFFVFNIYAMDDSIHVKSVKQVIADMGSINQGKLLFLVIRAEHDDMVKYLLDQGADVNIRDDSAQVTPLMEATFHGQIKTVKLLCAHNADINATVTVSDGNQLQQYTAMDYAFQWLKNSCHYPDERCNSLQILKDYIGKKQPYPQNFLTSVQVRCNIIRLLQQKGALLTDNQRGIITQLERYLSAIKAKI